VSARDLLSLQESGASDPSSGNESEISGGDKRADLPHASKRRRGPEPGTLKRYAAADRELFPELERIMRTDRVSLSAAAQKLASGEVCGKEVSGNGTPLSHAKRLAELYRRELSIKKPP
jgi:hypothetical protein